MVKTPPDSIPGQAIKIPQDTGIAKKKKSYIFRTTHTHIHTHTGGGGSGENREGGKRKH